jgi:hypothetical protein
MSRQILPRGAIDVIGQGFPLPNVVAHAAREITQFIQNGLRASGRTSPQYKPVSRSIVSSRLSSSRRKRSRFHHSLTA